MNKKIDKRMQWIRIVEEYKNNDTKKIYSTDYEICSEVRICGILNYENEAILCGLLEENEKNRYGLYTYLLRVKHIEKEYKFNKDNYSNEGYFFKEGLVGELIALFSVYFQARFYLKATIMGNLTPNGFPERTKQEFQYTKPAQFINHEMFHDLKRNWTYSEGLCSFLDDIRKIDQKYHKNLIRSFHWYAEAIKEIGKDPELFYIKMVSAVEALFKFPEIHPDSLFTEIHPDSLEKKLKNLINESAFNRDERSVIKNWLNNRKISKKFSCFLEQYSKGFFKGGKRKAKQCHIYRNNLRDYAKRIYNARSAYLHCGKTMFISQDTPANFAKAWDLDQRHGMMVDRRSFKKSEQLPRLRWFERIVNYCLKNFIKQLLSNNTNR